MTCSDLSAMYKPWEASCKTADLVYDEFFEQGDKEKALSLPLSSELVDRNKTSEIPRMQIGFYKFIVMPAFELLKAIHGKRAEDIYNSTKANQTKWQELQDSGKPYISSLDGAAKK